MNPIMELKKYMSKSLATQTKAGTSSAQILANQYVEATHRIPLSE